MRVWCGGAREPRVTIGRLFPVRATHSDLLTFQDLSGKKLLFFSDISRFPIIYEDVGHYINFNMTLKASNVMNTEWEENFKKLIRRWKKVLFLQVKIQKKLNFDRTWRVADLYILLEKITDEINCVRLDLRPINLKQ